MDILTSVFGDHQRDALKQDTRTPLYHQLYTLLKNSILNGTFASDTQMPTEAHLSEYFDVSRITAKRAMDELASDGLVERRRGRGTRVTYDYAPQPLQAPLIGMLQEIESMARHSDAKVITCKQLQPPSDVKKALNLGDEQSALYLLRVRYRDDVPFGHYVSWTAGMDEQVTAAALEHIPRLEVFRSQGIEISHISQTITAVAATGEVAKRLNLSEGHPLLSLTRYSYMVTDGVEKLVDILEILYHPDHFEYQMDLKM